ncbi:hypothetical protein LINPERHAP1_LOCUS8130, partial [Linum perenne]
MNYKFYIKVLQVLFKFIFKVLGQGISLNYCHKRRALVWFYDF